MGIDLDFLRLAFLGAQTREPTECRCGESNREKYRIWEWPVDKDARMTALAHTAQKYPPSSTGSFQRIQYNTIHSFQDPRGPYFSGGPPAPHLSFISRSPSHPSPHFMNSSNK